MFRADIYGTTSSHATSLRSLPFVGVLREKIRSRTSFTKILANYVSEESFINAVYYKNILQATFLLRKCQDPVRRETTEGSSIEFIGYGMLQHEPIGCTVLFTRRQSAKV